jgi:hypothetical protein
MYRDHLDGVIAKQREIDDARDRLQGARDALGTTMDDMALGRECPALTERCDSILTGGIFFVRTEEPTPRR